MISIYRLNDDGTVPDYVIDGGYFAHGVDGDSPQDWDLVGITTPDAPGESFFDVGELENYLASIGGREWIDVEGKPVDLRAQALALWSRQ